MADTTLDGPHAPRHVLTDSYHALWSFVAATMVMVAAIVLVAFVGTSWVLVPVFALFLGVTAWVFRTINRMLADDEGDEPDHDA